MNGSTTKHLFATAATKTNHPKPVRLLTETRTQQPRPLLNAEKGKSTFNHYLFDEMPERSVLEYNAVIKSRIKSGASSEAIKLFAEMIKSGTNSYTYPLVIKACSELALLDVGRVVYGHALLSGFGENVFVKNSLLGMYMNCGLSELARRVFDSMEERSVVSWNTIISGYFKNGRVKQALAVFNEMAELGIEIDGATVASVLPACGYLKKLEMGRKIHALVEENGLVESLTVRNALIDMYVKCGSMCEARLVFDGMVQRDVVTWTSMINGSIINGDMRSALSLCWMMQIDSVRPNSVTVASLLSACGSLKYLKQGRCLHGWVIRRMLDSEVIVESSLIDMYAKCNCVSVSFKVFTRTSRQRTVPWNAMLAGCIHNGLAAKAIELFKQMLAEGVEVDNATLNSSLPAFGIVAGLEAAKSIHCYIMKSGFLSKVEVATSLIDIYGKCGTLESAHMIFEAIPNHKQDIYVWSVIVASYGNHGYGETAVSLYREMVQSGVKPNEVTLTSVLHACSHAGLVDDGLRVFHDITKSQIFIPNDDHYTCIVDLLGRAGRLNEAYEVIRTMPFSPSHAVCGALLGACVIHGNVELGEIAAHWLFELEPGNTGNYILLSKLYAAVGRWYDAQSVRHMINDIGLRKEAAHSQIDARYI